MPGKDGQASEQAAGVDSPRDKAEKPVFLAYRTFERYPNHRVDLTELFSAGLAGRGHRIDWVMQSEAPAASQILQTGENERTILGKSGKADSGIGKVVNRLLDVWLSLRLISIAWKNPYDAIQVRDNVLSSLTGLIAAKLKGIPFFYWMSYPYVEDQLERARIQTNRPWIVRALLTWHARVSGLFLYKLVLPLADHVFVQSDEMKRRMVLKGVKADKMSPYPMAISLGRLDPAIKPHEDPRLKGRLPVIYVGTMVRMRRMDFLVRAFAKVREAEPKALLLLVGSADRVDMEPIEEEVRRLGLEKDVLFTGFVPMAEAWSYTLAAHVGVSPLPPDTVLDVGSPTKVIEYLAWNKPVVANSHPDQSLILKESGAGIDVPYDEDAFAEAIVKLLKDPDLAEQMGSRGYSYVEKNRCYEILSANLEREYLRLTNKSGSAASA